MLQFLHISLYIKFKETKHSKEKDAKRDWWGLIFPYLTGESSHGSEDTISFSLSDCAFISHLLWSLNMGVAFF